MSTFDQPAKRLPKDQPMATCSSLACARELKQKDAAGDADRPRPIDPASEPSGLRWQDMERVLSMPVPQLAKLLSDPSCVGWLYEQLRGHRSARIRALVAKRGHWPELTRDPKNSVRAAAARWSRLMPGDFIRLRADPSAAVRRALAANPQMPDDLRASMSSDSDAGVRAAAARAIVLSWNLRPFVNDPETVVRVEVAGNRITPLDLLGSLASDAEAGVRLKLARHPYTPWTAMESLRHDSNTAVRAAAAKAMKARESRLWTLHGEDHWRAIVARYGRPVPVREWPRSPGGSLFTIVTSSDGYGSGDVNFRAAVPEDLERAQVFRFPAEIPVLGWVETVGHWSWERLGDVPCLFGD